MSIYPSGTLIANRYEVVQGPREKPSLAGGMGLVYLCVDHAENGRPVALKTFRPELLPNRAARDLFLREGTTWVELGKHPHIVRCYRVITDTVGLGVFFVLELVAAVEGKRDASLRSWLNGKALDQEQALRLALQLAYGMQHATMKIPNLVHRDLKPENILVGRDHLARITDFGLVQAIQEASSQRQIALSGDSKQGNLHRTQLTHDVAGTPLYMAPEQWRPGKLTVATDIYAFGCILYEMLTGCMAQVSSKGAYKLALDLPADLPSSLKAFIMRCITQEAEKRFVTWAKAIEALASIHASITGTAFRPVTVDEKETAEERLASGYSFGTIGLSYHDIGKFSVAQKYFERVLTVARSEHDRRLETAALGNLGNACFGLGNVRAAIGYHEQSLDIARMIGDRSGEGKALGNLSNAYVQLGNARRAIGYQEKRLAISRELGDRHGEGLSLGNLALAHAALGNVRAAIEYYEQSLAIARELGDRHGEGRALGNLGLAYADLGDARSAIEYYEQHLAIARKLGDRLGEGIALGNLGNGYLQTGSAPRAIEYYEQRLAIAREIGDRHGEGQTLGNLGSAYFQMGDARAAIEYYERRLAIACEIGDRHGEGTALGNIGGAYLQLGDNRRAAEYFEQSLKIKREIGDAKGAAETSLNLATLLMKQRDFNGAQIHARAAGEFFSRIGHNEMSQRAQALLVQIQAQQGK